MTDWQELLADARQRAEHALTLQTGSESLCEIQKDRPVTGNLKYAEGRLVALSLLQRRLKGAHWLDPETLTRAELDGWRQDLARHQGRPSPTTPWLAYCQGGCDALTEVLQGGEAARFRSVADY